MFLHMLVYVYMF